jgi:hypothetical protein
MELINSVVKVLWKLIHLHLGNLKLIILKGLIIQIRVVIVLIVEINSLHLINILELIDNLLVDLLLETPNIIVYQHFNQI